MAGLTNTPGSIRSTIISTVWVKRACLRKVTCKCKSRNPLSPVLVRHQLPTIRQSGSSKGQYRKRLKILLAPTMPQDDVAINVFQVIALIQHLRNSFDFIVVDPATHLDEMNLTCLTALEVKKP